MSATLAQLARLFAALSLLAFGGGNAVIPDMQRAAVGVHHWVTDREFLDLFAISRAAPGPGSLLVMLIGQRAAGLSGAVVAGLAMFVPSCTLVWLASRAWGRFQAAPWRAALERALAPVAVGLIYAAGIALIRGTEHDPLAWGITAAATLALSVTEVNPVLVMAAAALFRLAVPG